jgi:hypothetical protein
MKWHDFIPVVTSFIVLVLVAVLERQSKLFAAVTATMPLTMPLALWIVYSANRGEQLALEKFTSGLVLGIIPTFAFAVAVWLASRAGFKLAPILVTGYAVWVVTLLTVLGLRRIIGGAAG